ncbi:MAG: cysteine desulfurase [Bdellovibrionales bacterium]|nr:cysteine desulfurase [Bdellovibrionales bacterium]
MKNLGTLKKDFPQLNKSVRGNPFVYLDSAATALKPQSVIDRINHYYSFEIANVHRGAHFFADQGTGFYEAAREKVARFIGSTSSDEIIFTRGTTESINLVASILGDGTLKAGDEILLTELEHHSNIVPWQLVAEKVGVKIRVAPILESCDIDLNTFKNLLSANTKIVSFLSVSNALGVLNPVKKMIQMAKEVGAITLVDAAQSVTTIPTDVQAWGCDFLTFSGHKMFGPTGIGVLYGKNSLLNSLPPYQGGGSMIDQVSFEKTTYLRAPQRFEAGTPHVAGAVGLHAAIDFIESIGIQNIREVEKQLVAQTVKELQAISGVKVLGNPSERINVVSFVIDGIHHGDLGALLDQQGVAVRVGHHCCQPLMKKLGVEGTVRASLSIYNTEEDVDRLITAVKKAKEFF